MAKRSGPAGKIHEAYRPIAREARRQGFEISQLPNGHLGWEAPTGRSFQTALTPSRPAVSTVRAQVRQALAAPEVVPVRAEVGTVAVTAVTELEQRDRREDRRAREAAERERELDLAARVPAPRFREIQYRAPEPGSDRCAKQDRWAVPPWIRGPVEGLPRGEQGRVIRECIVCGKPSTVGVVIPASWMFEQGLMEQTGWTRSQARKVIARLAPAEVMVLRLHDGCNDCGCGNCIMLPLDAPASAFSEHVWLRDYYVNTPPELPSAFRRKSA